MRNAALIIFPAADESDRLLFKEAFVELKIKSVVHTLHNGMKLMDCPTIKDAALPHLSGS